MTEHTTSTSEKGWEIARRQHSHPGRVRLVLDGDRDPFGSVSLPLVFLAGILFEGVFVFQERREAAVVLNVITVLAVVLWTVVTVRRHGLRKVDPLLFAGNSLLVLGAISGLLGMPALDDIFFGVILKTLGTLSILISVDRIERRRVLSVLRNSEDYLESIFESIPEPVFVIGPGRRIIAANRVAITTFGAGMLGRVCCEAYLDHRDCSNCTVTDAWDKRKPRHEIVRDDSGARRYEVTTFPLFGRHGFSGKLIQQIRDVSQQARTEDRASLFQDVVNSVQDPVLTLGLGGELLHHNRAAEALVGREADGAPRRAPGALLPFASGEDADAFLQALRSFTPWEREVCLWDRSADDRNMAVLSLAPIRAIDDRLLGTVVVIRDVTEVKRLQNQLIQTEKLGALGEMVSGVAHELNNPLTAVFGFAQLLLAEDLPEDTREEVRHIYTHAERCKRIIDGLLKFARQHRAEKALSDLNEVVRGAADLLRYQLRLANVELMLELEPDLAVSSMDSFQIQQVLINLITNAQQAIEEREGAGTIRVHTCGSGQESLILTVEDDGCGMPEPVLRRMFDPFYTTKGIGKGTGLGLALSYGIIKDHGGSMTARSRLGSGTTFRVELPVVTPGGALSRSVEVQEPVTAPPCRVLVVDDEPVILELICQILGTEGHEAVTRSNSQQALELLESESFDAVLSDWRMPGGDGEDFYRQLVERWPSYQGRVVFITGDSLDTDVAKFAEGEGNHVLNKPFSIESLREVLAEIATHREAVH